jgi:hypothetical protein
MAKSEKRKEAEERHQPEVEAQRFRDKVEEQARFTSVPPEDDTAPASTWAGRRLKVIVKVVSSYLFIGIGP